MTKPLMDPVLSAPLNRVLVLVAFLASHSTAFAQRVPITVKVLDYGGKAVANTPVASVWVPKFPKVELPLIPMEPFYTGRDGLAIGTAEGSYPIVISAFDQDKHMGGFVAIYKDTKEAVIRLLPMRPVRVVYSVSGLRVPIKTGYMEIQLVVPDGRPNSTVAREGYAFPLSGEPIYLPPGQYRFRPGAENAEGGEKWLSVPAGEGTFETPVFELTSKKVATLSGRPAPDLNVVGAMNAANKVDLASYRGKWVLIDFWGTWCSACRQEMPSLIDFYERNKSKRSKFEILAVHDSTITSVPELKKWFATSLKAAKRVPFPVLLDRGGKTIKAYGINAFPSHVLIDPNGRVVEGGNLETLRRELAKLD